MIAVMFRATLKLNSCAREMMVKLDPLAPLGGSLSFSAVHPRVTNLQIHPRRSPPVNAYLTASLLPLCWLDIARCIPWFSRCPSYYTYEPMRGLES